VVDHRTGGRGTASDAAGTHFSHIQRRARKDDTRQREAGFLERRSGAANHVPQHGAPVFRDQTTANR
jgi:hypothetical protein